MDWMSGETGMSNKLIKESKQKKKVTVSDGVIFYNTFGWIFVFCGIGSFLLKFFVSLMPQNYEKYNIPLMFGIWTAVSVALLVIGIVPLVLGKYSKRFQNWANKDVDSFGRYLVKQEAKQEKKRLEKSIKRDKRKGLDNKLEENQLELEMADRILDIVDSKSE